MRLFTGIDLPSDMLLRLERLICALRPEALIKWSPIDNLHVTTKFIGEWPPARLAEMEQALSSMPMPPLFDIEIRDLGWFPNERSPRVLWAGVHGGDALRELAHTTEQHLQTTLGITPENRPYEPHLTLARIKSPVPLQRLRTKVREMQPAPLGSFAVDHFVLYRSEPGSNASIYHKLHEYRFESVATAAVAAAGKI